MGGKVLNLKTRVTSLLRKKEHYCFSAAARPRIWVAKSASFNDSRLISTFASAPSIRSEEHTSELQSPMYLRLSLHDALPILIPAVTRRLVNCRPKWAEKCSI